MAQSFGMLNVKDSSFRCLEKAVQSKFTGLTDATSFPGSLFSLLLARRRETLGTRLLQMDKFRRKENGADERELRRAVEYHKLTY